VAGPAGTLLVLDDLQWAGSDALDLLMTLVRSGSTVPLRVIGAYRDTEVQSPDPLAALLADLAAVGLEGTQPRRLGTALNAVGPVWRSGSTLLGFAPQADGTLALRSLEPDSGVVQDLGVRLPAGTAQGAGLSARWDARHGSALLLIHPSNSPATSAALQAWLVSFVRPSPSLGVAH
jgi:hypothetical protein